MITKIKIINYINYISLYILNITTKILNYIHLKHQSTTLCFQRGWSSFTGVEDDIVRWRGRHRRRDSVPKGSRGSCMWGEWGSIDGSVRMNHAG